MVDELALLARCALVRASLHRFTSGHEDDSTPTVDCPLNDAEQRAVALGAFAARLVGDERAHILTAALVLAQGPYTRGRALGILTALVEEPHQLATATRAVQAMKAAADAESREQRIPLAAYLPEREAVDLVVGVLLEVEPEQRQYEWPKLGVIAAKLPVNVLAHVWSWSRQTSSEQRHLIQAFICSGLPVAERGRGAIEVLDNILQALQEDGLSAQCHLSPVACWSAVAVVPCVSADGLARLKLVLQSADGMARPLIVAMAPHLVALGEIALARSLVDTLTDDMTRQRAWCRMVTRLPAQQRSEAWRQLIADWADDGVVWQHLDENIDEWLGAIGPEACLELLYRAAQRSPENSTTPWRVLVAVANASPSHAPAITQRLVEEGSQLDASEHEALFRLVPLAPYMPEIAARRLVANLLSCLSLGERGDLLDDWTGDNLSRLVPLLERASGTRGLYAVAKQVIEVGECFP